MVGICADGGRVCVYDVIMFACDDCIVMVIVFVCGGSMCDSGCVCV